ncbi:MAG: hypothetical protein U5K69_21130 [Balneolaceae bacterium]|nr:hypothetical protein [Balneolaceae bacterium]
MNITIDIILPPIIVAMLTGMILTTSSMIIDSTVENRLTYELQNFANTSLEIIAYEVRGSQEVLNADGPDLHFIRFNQDTVHMYKSGRNLLVATDFAGTSVNDTTSYPAKFGDLVFDLDPAGIMLTVSVTTESRAEQEVGNNAERFKGFAVKDIYLRNLHLSNP